MPHERDPVLSTGAIVQRGGAAGTDVRRQAEWHLDVPPQSSSSPRDPKEGTTRMQTLAASRHIDAAPETIVSILLNIAELADWNPALSSTGTQDRTARIDHPYPVSTRVPGRATLTYVHAERARITWRLDVNGGTETGDWELQPGATGTRVAHTMTHTGALFSLMRHAMNQVPDWRLDRLQERAERRR